MRQLPFTRVSALLLFGIFFLGLTIAYGKTDTTNLQVEYQTIPLGIAISTGAVGSRMYNYSLGIQRKEPGFPEFILRPTPDPDRVMTWAKGYYDSMHGRIESEWRWEDGQPTYKATVPATTTATLYLPADSVENVRESGTPVAEAERIPLQSRQDKRLVFRLTSGSYTFVIHQ